MDWLEILIPVIIIAFYVFGGLFGKRGGGEDQQAPDPRTLSPEQQEAIRERERVQEDIRRRILERRKAAEAEFQQKQAGASGQTVEMKPTPEPVASARTRAREMRRPTNIPQAPDRPEAPEHPVAPSFSWAEDIGATNPYTRDLDERRRQIAETQRKADELRRKHGVGGGLGDSIDQAESNSAAVAAATAFSTSLSGIKRSLNDPKALRAAFVFSEIVGKPVSLRQTGDENRFF